MINVLACIALMGFISVLYVIGVLYIDEEKLGESCNDETNLIWTCASGHLEFVSSNLTFAGWMRRCSLEELDVDETINNLICARNMHKSYTFTTSPSVII